MRVIFTTVLILILSLPVFGQDKVGSETSFLRLSHSVKANGMGNAGVALFDEGSPYFNPACAGFVAEDQTVQLEVMPFRADLIPDAEYAPGLNNVALKVKLLDKGRFDKSRKSLGVAFYRSNLLIADIPETTYEYPDGTGRYFDISSSLYCAAVGFSWEWLVDMGAGASFKFGKEKAAELETDYYLFDFGFLLKKRWANDRYDITPSVGGSWSNYGPDIEIDGLGYANPSDGRPVPGTEYEPPKTRRFGAAIDFGMVEQRRIYKDWSMLSARPSFEIDKLLSSDKSRTRMGIELGVYDALFMRGGMVKYDGSTEYKSWGFTVNSRGIARLIAKGMSRREGTPVTIFESRLEIELSYAKHSDEDDSWYPYGGTNFFGISISY